MVRSAVDVRTINDPNMRVDKESIQLRKAMWEVIQQSLNVQRLAASEQAASAAQPVYVSDSEVRITRHMARDIHLFIVLHTRICRQGRGSRRKRLQEIFPW